MRFDILTELLLKAHNFWGVTLCHLVCTFLTCQRNVAPSAPGSGSPQRESGTTQPMTQHHIPEESDIPHPA